MSRILSFRSSCRDATAHGTLTKKFAHPFCDKTAEVFQREVAGINQMQFRRRDVSLVGLSPFDGKKRIVLSPENQHSRLSAAEVLMPTVVLRNIRLIVAEQVELNFRIAWTIKKVLVQRIGIRANSIKVCDAMCVLEYGGVFCQEPAHRLLGVGIAIGPERLHRIECRADTFLVGITVLHDNALDSIWMF